MGVNDVLVLGRRVLLSRQLRLDVVAMMVLVLGVLSAAMAQAPIRANGTLDVLPQTTDVRVQLQHAAWHLADGPVVELAGVRVDAQRLAEWASTPPGTDVQDLARSDLARAIDLGDVILMLDDVIAQARSTPVVLPAGRARSAGLLIHPTDVFRAASRNYVGRTVQTDRPTAQRWVPPALDGDPLGVRWTTRFANPGTAAGQLDAIRDERPNSDLPERIALLTAQLEAQGAVVWVTSTARDPRRGYLLWGSFILSKADSPSSVARVVARLEKARTDWGLTVPIEWNHPDGWRGTVRAATEMAETYDVVYATEGGARSSNHYGGFAVDMVALGLPETLVLYGPDGAQRQFDLSGSQHTRDLSLEPELIRWIERHYRLRKLDSDYPHWTDIDR